ncbi:DUF1275 domain-containing protein [Pseudooceanicola sp. CBS1P-1]|uniref:DUF1275 domain-containing protein n=1 Tax=Pseudooceanicola albus TaxID=2692189 RepID=A0A6L7G5I0_9RHOB|nr:MULTISPECIES: YoaK family protein [Pseudooceanicola]MBT9385965.1 DUF1275 domain-containing protein [Pseudooceanicola endophyticus]MXN19614.1 DUF1275 domain-containing protein [Pseudooceanicola albus]
MLIHSGASRSTAVDLRLAVLLASVAGAVNAAGFRALGFFSANMTGNVSALADHLAQGLWGPVALAAGLVAAFIAGAFVSALLIERGRAARIRGIYAYSIVLEALIIAAFALADLLWQGPLRGEMILLGLSLAMGLQNAASTRISDGRVRTTHLSGISTDLGIELAVLLGGARDPDTRAVVAARFRLHVATLLAFAGGGVLGALLYGGIGALVYLLAAAALLAIALPELGRSRTADLPS